jgi:hypothetical protein
MCLVLIIDVFFFDKILNEMLTYIQRILNIYKISNHLMKLDNNRQKIAFKNYRDLPWSEFDHGYGIFRKIGQDRDRDYRESRWSRRSLVLKHTLKLVFPTETVIFPHFFAGFDRFPRAEYSSVRLES